MRNEPYSTDLTDAAWALIAPLVPAARNGGRPRTTDLRAVLNAIFYLLRTGCQWRVHGELQKEPKCRGFWRVDTIAAMHDFLILFVHVIVTLARLTRPGGIRSVIAESTLIRHQLLVLNRGRKRAPNLRAADRIIAGLCTLFLRPARVLRCAIVLKASTLLRLHSVLRKRKYRALFSPERRASAWSEGTEQRPH
jgi:hypothetical protein